ncbi:DUF2461 domain-containing protein [Persicobacter sp. CCB-QB2]|uniref:DUF2461 domain-containing protein n=1 Tax=Persicobacter sp. CCB-QB2 TaxID=1561025 RepID=UPI0006A94917|nr:DUF2461 domain-containing protein [Persicobacter sp. CCB-QB2]
MISQSTFDFINELKTNNNREWFNEHKPKYQKALAEFVDLMGKMIAIASEFDPIVGQQEAKKSVFRIYRDIRFSKDKRPYKEHFGGWLSGNPKSDRAGYYIHLEPGKCMIAGGVWQPQSPRLKSIREEISYNGEQFKSIVEAPAFKKMFGNLQGDELKTAPKGYDKADPLIEYLRKKDFLAIHYLKDEDFMDDKIVSKAKKIFEGIAPLNAFLNEPFDNGE